ncbi:Lsr2 family protein [Paeniglutamicibacter antarcticus]|uniref:Lsr2 family protein n=1 Tax=Arthrobacter terrae TaxID=2935737 RepID=A0A931G3L2_9MICC|nr:Lsr2 family protein [Arthrobacter terrae]MBG0738791.1 Lsr2 family protein [Arthrobacter terrae]
MAQKITIHLLDDLDGTTASETIQFGLDKVSYEIDLTEENAQKIRDALAPFIAAARTKPVAAARKPSTGGPDTKNVRRWALANGMNVNPRGRIKSDIVEKFLAAQAA